MNEYKVEQRGRYVHARATHIPIARGMGFPYGESRRVFSGFRKEQRANRWIQRQKKNVDRYP